MESSLLTSSKQQNRSSPEKLFFSSLKSEATKRNYGIYLAKFVQYIGCKSVDDLMSIADIENVIIEFIIKLKDEDKMNYRSIVNYICPVILFYKINDIMLNSTKLRKFMPSKTRVRKNRGYTHEEIQKLLQFADERMRAVVSMLVSGGMRIGSIPSLHVRDLERKQQQEENLYLYKVTIYENEEEEYFTFLTPEASQAVDTYLDMRKRYGEHVGPDSVLIREQFDSRDPFSIASPKSINSISLTGKLAQLAERAGIREKTPLKEGQYIAKRASVRKEVPVAHGFRKSFTTFALNAKMDIIKRRMLEGHSVGIDDHYAKPSEQDLLEEYMKAIDNLTINEENRLKRKVEKLELEKTEIQGLKVELDRIKNAVGIP